MMKENIVWCQVADCYCVTIIMRSHELSAHIQYGGICSVDVSVSILLESTEYFMVPAYS